MQWKGSIFFLGTDDLVKTDHFYREVLKLKLILDQGLCRIYEIQNGGQIGFCGHHPVSHQGKSPIITLLTDDVDQWYAYLKQQGIEVENQPQVNEKFKIYHFFVKDPDGYTVEIQKFL